MPLGGFTVIVNRVSALVRSVAIGAAALVLATFVVAVQPPTSASALSGSEFDPGNIISDYAFFHDSAMTEAEIQAFLAAQSGACLNTNCLDILKVTTPDRAATTRCQGYEGAANEPASRVLFKIQRSCGVSAKALLVTLQKEQSLVTALRPSDYILDRAMGYYCPDDPNRPGWCHPDYAGFFNQVYNAAGQFKRYAQNPQNYNFQVGVENIQYHPTASCGTKRVTIANQATAGLYNYTPYTPNAPALNNLFGTGDACSTYGNRNFWRIYSTWFGSPTTTVPSGVATSRFEGSDRFVVSAGVAAQFTAPAPVVYIANGMDFPDALSAGPAAGSLGGPLLLVQPTVIPPSVALELARLKPARIVIAGGPSSVSETVLTQLKAYSPTVTRIDGPNRYAVSRGLALDAFGAAGAKRVYLATGRTFPDALSAGAAAGAKDAPVILVDGKQPTLDAETAQTLASLKATQIVIAGGEASVSAGIQAALSALPGVTEVTRYGGEDRYIVSAALNRAELGPSATMYLALGSKFPDALSGTPLAVVNGAPLYVTPGDCIPPSILDDIRLKGVKNVVLVGGVGSLTARIEEYAGC